MESVSPVMLRPLGIGEIFDRAVTLYVKNIVVFVLMLLTALVPVSALEYFIVPEQSATLTRAIDQIEHPEKAQKDPASALPAGGALVALLAVVALSLLLQPIANNAIAVGVGALYTGKRPDFATCFRTSVRRFPQLLAVMGMVFAAGVVAYIAAAALLVLLIFVGVLLVQPALPLAVILFVLAGLLVVAILAIVMLLIAVAQFAFYAVALENCGPVRALELAFRRIFNKDEVRKALLVVLAVFGVLLGISAFTGTIGIGLALLVKNYALQLAASAVLSAVFNGFLIVLLAVYYYDVRIRREGLDMESDLQRLTSE